MFAGDLENCRSYYFSIPGYSQLQVKSRHHKQGGGVGFYFKNEIQFRILTENSIFVDQVLETSLAEIVLPSKKKIVIGSLYRPGTNHPSLSSTEQFTQAMELLANLLNFVTSNYEEIYLFGDLNIDVLKYNNCKMASEYVDLLFSYGLLQTITKPTRCTVNSATLIDHSIILPTNINCENLILVSKISDHFPILFFRHSPGKKVKAKEFSSRDFSDSNINKFKQALQNFDWNFVMDDNDVQVAFSNFSNVFHNLYNLYFPIVVKKFNKNVHYIEKWMSKGILISRTQKIKMGKLCHSHPLQENLIAYRNYRNLYNTVIRVAKRMFFEKELVKAQSNLKKTWSILKNAINKNCKKSSPIELNIDGVLVSDPKIIANNLNVFFTNVARQIVEEIPPSDIPLYDNVNMIPNDIPLLNFSNTPVTCTEILETLKLLQPKLSQDFNGLSMYLVKKLSFQLAKPLCHLINLSFSTGVVPTQLKIAKIIPIFKSGDPLCMDNYRPISLLSCFSKIFEKIACIRLSIFLENNKLLSDNQFGFRSNHSTVHPMLKFMNHVSNALNKKKHCIAIFCDLRKAFDTVDHEILFKKLERLGICGSTLKWFKSYLSERKQFVSIDGVLSDLLEILIGVPQGSILGPILFLIYVNDLPEWSNLLALLFADDTTLLASDDNIDDLILHVNSEFKKIVTFFRAHKLSLHPEKTQFILFTNSTIVKQKNIPLVINMNNHTLDNPGLIFPMKRISSSSDTPAVKFLGIYFDPDLNFKIQIRNISSKISKSLFILRRAKTFLSEKALKTLYYSLIHCHLIYGIHIWSSTAQSNLKELVLKQKNAIRIITSSKYNSHTSPLFKQSKILPFESLVMFFKLQFMSKYVQGLLPSTFNNVWLKRESWRADNFTFSLRNSEDLYIPTALLSQTERQPLFLFPRLWSEFDVPAIKIIRNVTEFNVALKEHLLNNLPSVVNCTRLFCPSCSNIEAVF